MKAELHRSRSPPGWIQRTASSLFVCTCHAREHRTCSAARPPARPQPRQRGPAGANALYSCAIEYANGTRGLYRMLSILCTCVVQLFTGLRVGRFAGDSNQRAMGWLTQLGKDGKQVLCRGWRSEQYCRLLAVLGRQAVTCYSRAHIDAPRSVQFSAGSSTASIHSHYRCLCPV